MPWVTRNNCGPMIHGWSWSYFSCRELWYKHMSPLHRHVIGHMTTVPHSLCTVDPRVVVAKPRVAAALCPLLKRSAPASYIAIGVSTCEPGTRQHML